MRSHCATLLVSWPVHEPNTAVCSGARRQPAAKTGSIDKAAADTRALRQCAGDEKVADRSAYRTAVSFEVMPSDACSNEMKHSGAGRSSRDLEPPAPVMCHGPLPEREGVSQAERAAIARVHSGFEHTSRGLVLGLLLSLLAGACGSASSADAANLTEHASMRFKGSPRSSTIRPSVPECAIIPAARAHACHHPVSVAARRNAVRDNREASSHGQADFKDGA